jgi:hypothetical protein
MNLVELIRRHGRIGTLVAGLGVFSLGVAGCGKEEPSIESHKVEVVDVREFAEELKKMPESYRQRIESEDGRIVLYTGVTDFGKKCDILYASSDGETYCFVDIVDKRLHVDYFVHYGGQQGWIVYRRGVSRRRGIGNLEDFMINPGRNVTKTYKRLREALHRDNEREMERLLIEVDP